MYHDADLPHPAVPANDDLASTTAHAGAWPAPTVAPPRFGRLAMGVATASALAIGVMGTVAYGIWFNHDQQAYAEAIAGARQALGASATAGVAGVAGVAGAANAARAVPNPTVNATVAGTSNEVAEEQGGRLASWSGQVARPSTPDPESARAADATPTAAVPSSASRRRSAAADPPTQQLTAARSAKDARATDARAAPSERRVANTQHKSLFARMGQFFRRVGYRQHGNANQQDIYSHP